MMTAQSNITDEQIVSLQACAEAALNLMHKRFDHSLGYDEKTIKIMDEWLWQRVENNDINDNNIDNCIKLYGCFLGEALVRTYNGKWTKNSNGYGVEFSEGNIAFPLNKTQKRLSRDGDADSLLSFFTLIPLLFTQATKSADQ